MPWVKFNTCKGSSAFGRGMARGSPPVPNTDMELNSSYSTCETNTTFK